MVLQKAKQRALEEAGTCVESYTHVRNLDLTMDDIKTIAGGVMKTEIVEQNREQLKGNGLRFYVKIRALVTTDKMEDLARRIRGGNLASENKRLQDAIANLTKDLDLLKRQVPETETESEREVVLDKIREIEKQFREILSTEKAFYKRLVSGEELVAKAEREFRNEQRRREEEHRQQERLNQAFEQLLRST
jgi:plasmid stability protein